MCVYACEREREERERGERGEREERERDLHDSDGVIVVDEKEEGAVRAARLNRSRVVLVLLCRPVRIGVTT